MTTTDEQIISENSQQETVLEPKSNTTAASEPENLKSEAANKTNSAQIADVPEKFRNKDGSANINALIKSYKELEPLINEKANWTKEKEFWQKEKNDLTGKLQTYERKNLLDLSESEKVQVSTTLYEKLIDKSKDKSKAALILKELKNSMSEEKLKELENLFPTDIVKEVSLKSQYLQSIYQNEYLQRAADNELKNAEEYFKKVLETNAEEMKNPQVYDLFNEAFKRFGTQFDSEWFFSKVNDLKKSFIEDYQKSQLLNNEKESALNIAGKLTPKNEAKGGTPLSERNVFSLSQEELNRAVDDYFSRL